MASAQQSAPSLPLAVLQQGQGYPILCIHGHPGSAQCMNVFTEPLSQRMWTLAPDLRGYGQSQVQSPFSMEQHLLDLEMLLDHHRIQQCLVLGWSLGGILALELALRQPERIAGLILVATAAHPVGTVKPPSLPELINTLAAVSLNWLRPGWRWNIETFGRQSILKSLISQHNESAYRFLASAGTDAVLKTSTYAHQAVAMALKQQYDRRQDIEGLLQPCLLLSGADDQHILSQSTAETAQHLQQSHHICYPDVAHLFPWEIPTQVNQDIQGWIQSLLDLDNSRPKHSDQA